MEYKPIGRQETYVPRMGMEPLYTYCVVRLRARNGRDTERPFSYLVGDLPIHKLYHKKTASGHSLCAVAVFFDLLLRLPQAGYPFCL